MVPFAGRLFWAGGGLQTSLVSLVGTDNALSGVPHACKSEVEGNFLPKPE